jgi:hypothetical protein
MANVCPECGAFVEDPAAATACPRCGARLHDDEGAAPARTVRAEYELQPDLIAHRERLAAQLGPGARVAPLPAAGPAGADPPPDGLVVELSVAADDPLAAIGAAARRLADAFEALGLPVRAVALECDGLPPVRIETRPTPHPFTG